MAISRAFAFSPAGVSFPGDQFVQRSGNIVYLEPGQTINFAATGLNWYNGPDEDDNVAGNGILNDFAGYIVCVEGATTDKSGNPTSIKFYKSNGKNEAAFIALVSAITGTSYATGDAAANDLLAMGYTTNWTITQQLTYTGFLTRTSPCGSLTTMYMGSDNKYYANEQGTLFTGFLYYGGTAIGGGEYSWSVNNINNGVLINTVQENSLCGPTGGAGSGGDQFLEPNP